LGWGGHTATPRAATSVGAILCSVTESARATAAGRMNLVNLPAEKHSDKRTLRTAEVTFIAVSWAQRIQNYCCIQRRQNSIVGDQNLKRRNAWEWFFCARLECWLPIAEMWRIEIRPDSLFVKEIILTGSNCYLLSSVRIYLGPNHINRQHQHTK